MNTISPDNNQGKKPTSDLRSMIRELPEDFSVSNSQQKLMHGSNSLVTESIDESISETISSNSNKSGLVVDIKQTEDSLSSVDEELPAMLAKRPESSYSNSKSHDTS